jgi:hypothetical protein
LYGTSTKSKQIPKQTEALVPNFNGYPTLDVLSSTSYFRNSRTNVVTEYKLGEKSTVYTNQLYNEETGVNYGEFKKPFASSIPSLGLFNLTNNGWTYSVDAITGWNPPNNTFNGTPTEVQFVSNISSTASLGVLAITFPSRISRGRFNLYLKNTFVRNLPNNRYFKAEVEVSKIIPNFNGVYSFDFVDTTSNTNITLDAKNFNNSRYISEYFYNVNSLDITIGVQDTTTFTTTLYTAYRTNMEIPISKIGFYEVDMIPFFNYYGTASLAIDNSLKNPIVAIAPIIDYTDTTFDFVGEIDLGIDYRVINNQNRVGITLGKASLQNDYQEPTGEVDQQQTVADQPLE